MSDDTKLPEVDLSGPNTLQLKCEFCGLDFWVDQADPKIMHELPMCNEFEFMDPIQYMIENRKRKQARKAAGVS